MRREMSGYAPLSHAPSIGVGLYVAVPPGSVPERLLRENAPLVHRARSGRLGLLHPAYTATGDSFQVVTFEPWCSWDELLGTQLVFRREVSADAIAARDIEKGLIAFDRPTHGPYRFVRLDFLYRTSHFTPLTVRVRQDGDTRFLRVYAGILQQGPTVSVRQIQELVAPPQLRTS